MFKLLKRLDKKDWLYVGISFVFVLTQVWLDLKLPDYMSEITTLLQTPGSVVSDLYEPGAMMLACAFGTLISAFIVGYFASRVAASFGKNVRREVFRKVNDFGVEEMNEFSTASLITRTTNDITQTQMLVTMGIQLLAKAPVMAVWAILKITNKSWQWSAATAVAIVVLLALITVLMIVVFPKFKIIQKLTDNLNRIVRENLQGIRVVRAYNAEEYQQDKFHEANSKLVKTNLFQQRVMGLMSPVMSFVMSGLTLAIYFIGAYLIDGAMVAERVGLLSDMLVFSSYAMQVIMAFMMMAMMFIIWPRASVSANRIIEVLEKHESIKTGNVVDKEIRESGNIRFNHVSFKYPNSEEYVLRDISFTAKTGETIAFIGSTGSGKSTLVHLVPRLYDATEGEIEIDGVNVKDYDLNYLHNKIGFVTQKAFLFSGTIASNIDYGESRNEIDLDKIKEAVGVAQGKEFIENLPEQYESHVAQGGTNLSGGQKQRVSIARAVAKDPDIYIFDDSFSALDYKTDFSVRKALHEYTSDATTLIVAQRIGTIKDADKIIVLDNGRMVGIGKHDELMADCAIYQEIALSQLSKEEL